LDISVKIKFFERFHEADDAHIDEIFAICSVNGQPIRHPPDNVLDEVGVSHNQFIAFFLVHVAEISLT
jgi:hypothetical protein